MGTANYDKYEPYGGGFRATLAADFGGVANVDLGVPFGVGLDTNGLVVKGVGTTGIVGVLVLKRALAAGSKVDVMTDGDIVDIEAPINDPGVPVYAVAATGVMTLTATGNTYLGHTVADPRPGVAVNAIRLVVRVRPGASA
jgi:hypothetical protein